MVLDAFEMNKNNDFTHITSWVREIPFISYGFITEVITDLVVIVKPVVQSGFTSPQELTVTLLSLSSALFELHVHPLAGDLVLLLSPQKYHPDMFQEVSERPEEEQILDASTCVGYSTSAQVGILMKTARYASDLSVSVDGEAGDSGASIDCVSNLSFISGRGLTAFFKSVDGETEYPVNIAIGPKRPTQVRLNSKRTVETGIMVLDGDNKVEVEAPITEKVHGKSPITRIIRAALNLTWGIGNDESKSEDEDRDANITVKMGAKSDISLESKSGLSAKFKKDVTIDSTDGKVIIKNNAINLCDLWLAFVDEVENLKTFGPPPQHVVAPDSKASLEAYKQKVKSLWGE